MVASQAQLEEFDTTSALYAEAIRLRDAVLRKPLGLRFPTNLADLEAAHRHFALLQEATAQLSRMRACLMVVEHAEHVFQIRQMAVCQQSQGRGYGSRLMREVEEVLLAEGMCHELFLNARATTLDFYRKLGYTAQGDAFLEVGIPHYLMRKFLR